MIDFSDLDTEAYELVKRVCNKILSNIGEKDMSIDPKVLMTILKLFGVDVDEEKMEVYWNMGLHGLVIAYGIAKYHTESEADEQAIKRVFELAGGPEEWLDLKNFPE